MPNPGPSCLLTGANGRLGRLLRKVWPRAGACRPIWLSRLPPADLCWSPDVALPECPPCSAVIALWGRTTGDAQTLAQNVALVAQGVRLAHACGAGRVLHLSTAAIYGPGRDMHETGKPAPVNAYGLSKLEMEHAIGALPPDGLHHVILRLANVVGADSLAPALADPARGVTLDRFVDGRGPRRSYVAPGDLARVLAGLARLPEGDLPDILNVAAPEPVAMEDLARVAGCRVTWRTAPPEAQAEVSLDTDRLSRLLPGALRNITPAQMVKDWQGARDAG
ncbi:NAD dependent epimerase/dehydratase family protein [Roseovarius sp. A-2]|uniref:NAD-dependent epimerase/dehydratase family protein n=1 Tax=Roseovarius sp. A-2 TaxID=1570360 RepID=UPI0009D3C436|nr:NAD-dependent epimerase/dehydratase family protein [Roseovarius sp. A-2]GAW33155.1 NAD dependent epimerase/dehydratase family protein [Roseovarius sp. A-2]